MKSTRGIFIINVFIVLAFCIVFIGCGSQTGLQSKIQQEFDSNPFLKEQKIKLTVVKEENGYVTVEIEGGGTNLIKSISQGEDIFGSTLTAAFQNDHKDELKTYNALKTAIDTVKGIKGVKVVSLDLSPKAIYQEGQAALRDNDVKKAVSLIQKAADRGLLEAQYDIAGAYLNGNAIPRDSSKALELYTKVAESGDDNNFYKYIARRALGSMYEKGSGVPQDYSKAIEWYLKAADYKENDFGIGLYNLAWLYATCKDPKYRDGQKSLGYALKAYSKAESKEYNINHKIMAAAYAASGNFEKAVEEQEKEINNTKTNVHYSNKDYEIKVFNTLEKQLALYKAHQPYIDDEEEDSSQSNKPLDANTALLNRLPKEVIDEAYQMQLRKCEEGFFGVPQQCKNFKITYVGFHDISEAGKENGVTEDMCLTLTWIYKESKPTAEWQGGATFYSAVKKNGNWSIVYNPGCGTSTTNCEISLPLISDKGTARSLSSEDVKNAISAAVGSAESIRGALAGYASASPNNLFPAEISSWDNLISICNANGASLKASMAEQGFSGFTYKAQLGEGGSAGDAVSYVVTFTVAGVPESTEGSKIVVSPAAIEKHTR